MKASSIRALLVDDEMLARLALRQALAAHPDITIVGECGNAADAMQAMESLKPDLLFLDIEMPGANGFEFLRELERDTLPMIVFATAHGQHALQAFDASALDYLLKPIDQDRFDRMMHRVRRHWRGLAAAEPGMGSSSARAGNGPWLRRLSVQVDEHIRVIATNDIDWIGADGNYVRIHVGGVTYVHRETLRRLQRALDPARFVRVHRGTIVNADRVCELHPLFNGNAELVLRDGTRVGLSRRFREHARRALGLP